ncbi:unnamed protein product [Blepharisma stoltei]|uniref:Exophilin 5 n=1 Tax=Blepharisma stoltei TaxID=1481888 RepID=A0AAU9IMH2_9CILI|nr:unnamed protein product [Blepharisma stoltei]
MNNPLFCKNLAQAFQFIPRKRIISAKSPRDSGESNADPLAIHNSSLFQFIKPNARLSPKQIIHQNRERIEDVLLRKGKESKEKKEIEKTKWIAERMSHFTYSPKINKQSKKLIEKKDQIAFCSTELASSARRRSNSLSVISNSVSTNINKNERAAKGHHIASNSCSNFDDSIKAKKIIPQSAKENPCHSRAKNKSQPICLMIPSKNDPNYPHDDGFDQSSNWHASDLVEKDKENCSKHSVNKKLRNCKKVIKSQPNSCNNSKVLKNSFLTEASIDSAHAKDIARNCSIEIKTARIYKKIIEDRKKMCSLINN